MRRPPSRGKTPTYGAHKRTYLDGWRTNQLPARQEAKAETVLEQRTQTWVLSDSPSLHAVSVVGAQGQVSRGKSDR
jgi:hypothetical protein